jgi:transcriptional regulator with XRE-family HTH domain
MASLGEELRQARESRRLSIPDVAEQIHIRSVYIQAIEEENWSSIAAPVYVRGFIRTYARFLGLDSEEVVTRFNGAFSESPPQTRQAPQIITRRRGMPTWLWALSLAATVGVLLVGYDYYRLQTKIQASVIAEAVPTARPRELFTAPRRDREKKGVGLSKKLTLKVEQRSWLRVMVDGRELMEGVFDSGVERTFQGKNVTVRAGNAGGVDIMVNGRDQGALGASGDVVERTFTIARR